MSVEQATTVVQHLRRIVGRYAAKDATDGQLLKRFVRDRDESALAILVRRHESLVWSVCRRVLPNFHDAEDAFQAVFLVLVRKAHTLGRPELLGNWLYGVAYRTARKAHVMRAQHLVSALDDTATLAVDEPADHHWSDLRPVLDDELSRLPEKYRVPVVLCYLEGRTNEQAAEHLGWPVGTVSGRLARARALLRGRLTRRGITLSAGSMAALLAHNAASAGAPSALVASTVHAAAAIAAGQAVSSVVSIHVALLAEGVIRAMCINKLSTFLWAGLLTALIGLGVTQLAAPAADDNSAGKKSRSAASALAFNLEKPALGSTVRGTLKAIDAGKNTIAVSVPIPGTKQADEKSYELAKDVRVILEDAVVKTKNLPEGKLSDLSEGISVTLQLDKADKKVVQISARGRSVFGSVIAVDAAASRITISGKDKTGAAEHSYALEPGVKVLLNDGLSKGTADQEGKLTELAEGTHVHLQISVDGKRALSVRVHGKSVRGTLKSHDAANSHITVTVKEDGALVDKTFKVMKDAQLLDLMDGAGVSLRLSVFDKETVVAAQGLKPDQQEEKVQKEGDKPQKAPDVTGLITIVGNDGKSITLELPPKIKGEPAPTVEIRLSDKTKLSYFGVDANGENPTIGYMAQVWLVVGSQDQAVAIRLGRKDANSSKGPDLVGQITAVSKNLKSITVDVMPAQKGDPVREVEIKLTDRTKLSYFGVDLAGQTPTAGYAVLVWLADGSKDTAAGLRLGRK